jgi:hypothetical protein
MPKVHTQIVNYQARERRRPRSRFVNVGFFVHQVPRLTVRCTLFGHRPVVDGTDPTPSAAVYIGRRNRWVVCDRCGQRPDPQGSLDPQRWNIGDRYTGGYTNPVGRHELIRLKDREHYLPGPFNDPDNSRGTLSGQLIVGRSVYGPVGFELKVGSGASEQPLAASLSLGWFGALSLATTGHGRGVQRRLNPDRDKTYLSKVIKVDVWRGRLAWRLWAARDKTCGETGLPWWRDGELNLRIGDRLFGRREWDHTDVPGGVASRLVRMPEADYLVQLKLRQVTVGRAGGPFGTGRARRRLPYEVSWSVLGKGIPTEGPLRGRIFGADVKVSDAAVEAGTWPAAAAAAIATDVADWRTRKGWEPTGLVKVAAGGLIPVGAEAGDE